MLTKNQKKIVLLLGALVAVVSVGYSFYFRIRPAVDARAYNDIAWNITQGNGYRESLDIPLSEDKSIVRVGPGYEFFLAGIFFAFGHHLEAVWDIQALLMVFSFFLVFMFSREVFKENWSYYFGLASAVLIGFSPDLITMQGMLMAETLGVFLVILTSYLFFRYYNNPLRPFWLVILLGLSLGAAGIVRTPALALFLPMAFYFVWNRNYMRFLIFIFAVIVLFIPWTIRNYNIFNRFIPTNAVGVYNLFIGNHHGASGEQGDDLFKAADNYESQLGYIKASDKETSEAIHFIVANPLEFFTITLKRINIYFSFARPNGFWFHLHGLSKVLTLISSSIYSVVLFTLGFWGVLQIPKLGVENKKRGWFLLFFLVMMPLSIVGLVVETRYRFLSYPFFAIFAGLAVEDIIRRRIFWKPALIVASLLFINTAIDILRNFGRIIDKIKTL